MSPVLIWELGGLAGLAPGAVDGSLALDRSRTWDGVWFFSCSEELLHRCRGEYCSLK